jgi:hypothetical protein
MTEHRNRIFSSLIDRGNALVLSDVACFDCEFANCALSLTTDIKKRAVVSNVLFKNCKVSASDIGPVVLKRVQIDGVVTDSLLIVWGAIFDQVVFSGTIGKIKFNRHIHHVFANASTINRSGRLILVAPNFACWKSMAFLPS